MDTTQYAAVLRALAYFIENASPASAEILLNRVTTLTDGFVTPKFKWTFVEESCEYRCYDHEDALLATICQSRVTSEWLVYFPKNTKAHSTGWNFIDTKAWVESQF